MRPSVKNQVNTKRKEMLPEKQRGKPCRHFRGLICLVEGTISSNGGSVRKTKEAQNNKEPKGFLRGC